MMISRNRARLAIAACAAVVAPMLLAGCNRVKQELLAPQNPGIVDPTAVASPTAAAALRVGAIGRYKQLQSCEGLWEMAGTLADEYKNADFLTDRIDWDQRQITPINGIISYSGITQSRGFIRDAITAMNTYLPGNLADIGELYMELGYIEMSLADNFCNGIPLGHTIGGVITNGIPLTGSQVYDSASAHLDTALALTTATDAGTVFVHNAALVVKARILVAKGQYAAAAALTTNVPTNYQYVMTFSTSSGLNAIWSLVNSIARITVSDSQDTFNGQPNVIQNALPFVSAQDPRVPTISGQASTPKIPAEDGTTPVFLALNYKNQTDPAILASGVDARLFEAEAKLAAGDIPGMMTILNTLRAAKPSLGTIAIPALPALPTPATTADAVTLLFRERGFWTFGRGIRLPDLRRLIRQYGRTEDKVFPKGNFFKGGTYGSDVNVPIPSSEQANPLFTACLDRKA